MVSSWDNASNASLSEQCDHPCLFFSFFCAGDSLLDSHVVYTVNTRVDRSYFHGKEFSVLRRYNDFVVIFGIKFDKNIATTLHLISRWVLLSLSHLQVAARIAGKRTAHSLGAGKIPSNRFEGHP